jgi:hypothetical protein
MYSLEHIKIIFLESGGGGYETAKGPGCDRKKHGLAVVNESRFSFHFFVSAR